MTYTSARLLTSKVPALLRRAAASAQAHASDPLSRIPGLDPAYSNITPSIAEKIGRNLHLQQHHPLRIIKRKIEGYFETQYVGPDGKSLFQFFDRFAPMVSIERNFDHLLVPSDHVSRSKHDTYYVNEATVLRTHTSAHQTEILEQGHTAFLCTGDVYRRDEIDASHYPVFHQMEGVRVFRPHAARESRDALSQLSASDLKACLSGMVQEVFGSVDMRWVDAYFPFTDPSFELEIFFKGEWLEVLGCGVIERGILDRVGLADSAGWAFGLGLERLAMVLFGIPDIRLFWSTDARFLDQFSDGEINEFVPFSKYPPCIKDVSFWVPEGFHENTLCEVIRGIAGDDVESVACIDSFTHPKSKRESRCYRIIYRSMERSLRNDEINVLQDRVRDAIQNDMRAELR